MKTLLIMSLAVGLAHCRQEIPASDFCAIANRTVYQGGEFKLTAAEVAALERRTKIKIAALKRTYREICLK